MFGNKFAADELAKNFQKELLKAQAFKKQASENKTANEIKPEDFLVAPEAPADVHGEEIDKKINEVSSYAKDTPCGKCHKVHDGDKCGDMMTPMSNSADDAEDASYAEDKEMEEKSEESCAEDMSYLVDKKAQYVLHQLGKIAGQLRQKNKGFAADMVEATAIEIKGKILEKAAQKMQVISGLKKMAQEHYQSGDVLTGDVISVTIENIKKSK